VGLKILNKISKSVKENNRPYKGFNMFDNDDLKLLYTITSGQFNVSGFQNKNLRQKLPDKSCFQISRMLKRLRTHGMIKKIGHTYKYYLTNPMIIAMTAPAIRLQTPYLIFPAVSVFIDNTPLNYIVEKGGESSSNNTTTYSPFSYSLLQPLREHAGRLIWDNPDFLYAFDTLNKTSWFSSKPKDEQLKLKAVQSL